MKCMEMQRQTAYSSEKSSEMMHGMHGGKFPFRPFLFCSCVVKYYQPKTPEEGLLLKWFQHLRTVQHHRFLVLRHCWRVGLYRQGLTHDLSKFSPVEFAAGARYYQGNRSPNEIERREKGYSAAWLHHKGRNRHHLEYWIDYAADGSGMCGMKMPLKYVLEMFCDRVAASKTYRGAAYRDSDPYDYYARSVDHYIIHPETAQTLEYLLRILRDEGEDRAFAEARRMLREQKKNR